MADVVVVAEAIAVEGVRDVGTGQDAIQLAQIRFRVTQAISEWDADSILVDFYLPDPSGLKELETSVTALPPSVMALREKRTGEPGRYRLVNAAALWTDQPDGGVMAPLDQDASDDFRSELASVEGIEDLVEQLTAARR